MKHLCSNTYKLGILAVMVWAVMGCAKSFDDDFTDYQRLSVCPGKQLYGIAFYNDSIALVSGGEPGNSGFVFRTADACTNWNLVYQNTKRCMYAVGFSAQGKAYAGGDYLQLDTSINKGLSWQFFDHHSNVPTNEFDRPAFRQFFFRDEQVYVIGGDGFKKGIFYRSHNKGRNWNFTQFANQMNAVWFTSPTKGFLGGNGLCLTTRDGGTTLQDGGLYQDFITDFWFISAEVGYCCSYNGAVYKTIDTGQHWEQSGGNTALNLSRKHYNALAFSTPIHGYLAADDGLMGYTKDGGLNWKFYSLGQDCRFTNIWIQNNYVYLTGTDGYVYKLRRLEL